jgi:hypothetical protein
MVGSADPGVKGGAACGFRAERAELADDPALRRLLRDRQMEGQISLTLEREPSFRRAQSIEGDLHYTIVVRDTETGAVLGMGSRSVREVFVNGERRRLGYLGSLRAAPGRRGLVRLSAGYREVEATRRPDELPFDVTSVVEDNSPARRLLERGLPGLPRYMPLCDYRTLLIPVGRSMRWRDSRVTEATSQDYTEIADCLDRNMRRYQFGPAFCESELRSNERSRDLRAEHFVVVREHGRIVACAACWDQRHFKQVVVRGYAPLLARARPALNLALRVGGRPRLPAVGSQIPMAYVSHLAVDGDRRELVLALIDAMRRRCMHTTIEALTIGFSRRHPLLPAIEGRYPTRSYDSCIYRVQWPGAPEFELDSRVPHLEVAAL